MNDTENPGSATATLEQPAEQTATSQVLETPTTEALPTTNTTSPVETPTITPPQTPVAETTNVSATPQQEQKKGFFSRILGGRGGNFIPSSQEDPATHNAVFQARQGEMQTTNSSMPDHLPNGQTPTMTNVSAEAASNAETPVAAPKFSQDALNSTPTETSNVSASAMESSINEPTTPTSSETTTPETISQPVQPLDPREAAGPKPEIPITQPLENSVAEPTVPPIEVTVVETPQTAVEPLNSETPPTDQLTTPDIAPSSTPDAMTPTNPNPLETPEMATTPTGDILSQAADVATQAEQTEGALPTDGAPAPATENTATTTTPEPTENQALNPTATADINDALEAGGVDNLNATPAETTIPTAPEVAESTDPTNPTKDDTSETNSGTGTPTPATI